MTTTREQRLLDGIQAAVGLLEAPLDTDVVLDTHAGRSLWKAYQAEQAKAILNELLAELKPWSLDPLKVGDKIAASDYPEYIIPVGTDFSEADGAVVRKTTDNCYALIDGGTLGFTRRFADLDFPLTVSWPETEL